MESFLWLRWCVWPVLRLLTNGISSFNTTMIFCFFLLLPQSKVLDYAKISSWFVYIVQFGSTPSPQIPPNFRQAETSHFIDFKNIHTLYPVSVIYMYTNLQILQIKKLWREQIHWLGVGKRLIGYKKQICMCFKNSQIYVVRDWDIMFWFALFCL